MVDEPILPGDRVPSLVLFDLDDTLCDHYSSLRLRLHFAFESALRDSPNVDLEALVEESARRSVGGTAHFADLLSSHGIAEPERTRIAIERYLSDRFRGLQLYDDSIEIVRHVRRYASVGMITNGPSQIQRNKIERLEIAHLFEVILVSEEEGIWKPDPGIFERALNLFGVDAGNAVFVGDSPEHDMAGAKAAGIRSIWINRRGRDWPGGPRPDDEIRNLRELPDVLGMPAPASAF